MLLHIGLWFLLCSTVKALCVDLLSATVADIVELLESGEVTSELLINNYLSRIEKHNNNGLCLRAVLEIPPYENLIQWARLCDAERKNGTLRGPLHGVPVLVKDNIATETSLGMNTTAGSFALCIVQGIVMLTVSVGSVVLRDATVIVKLRKAGAIILGKANLSEFAQFRGNKLPYGWSARGGQTQSAYVKGGYALPKTAIHLDFLLAETPGVAVLEVESPSALDLHP